jgi:hypothetical protein
MVGGIAPALLASYETTSAWTRLARKLTVARVCEGSLPLFGSSPRAIAANRNPIQPRGGDAP